jgi:RHS repeat-associated protein
MIMKRKYVLTLPFFLFSLCNLFAQTIGGPTPVNAGATQTYTFDNQVVYSNTLWTVNGGGAALVDLGRVGTTYSVRITWGTGGTFSLTFLQNYQPLATKSITVNCTTPANPVIPSFTVSSNPCGNKTISYTATPPAGATWYWQTTSGGTSTANPGNTFTVSTTGTYYVKANCGTFWSAGYATTPSVTVNSYPATPAAPTISVNNTCYSKVLSKTGANTYWQGTNSTGTVTASPADASTYTATLNGTNTYYVGAKSSANCWSYSSLAVTVDNPPAPAAIGPYNFCEWDAMTMTSASNVRWFDSNNVLVNTGTTYTPTNKSIGAYTYTINNLSSNLCQSSNSTPVTLNVTPCDNSLNWVESTIYGLNSNGTPKPIAGSKVYSDGFGNTMQAQVKSFANNQVFAAQSVYDDAGDQTLQTLPAPINSNTFGYRHRFITNNNSQRYSAVDFDGANLYTPVSVGNSGQGSLGWYYSSANNLEPNTPVTNYPYARTWTEPGPDPKVSKSGTPGDFNKMGTNISVSEKQKITSNELDNYFQLRPYFVPVSSIYNSNLLTTVSISSTSGFTAVNSNLIAGGSPGSNYISAQAINTNAAGVYPIGGSISVTPGKKYTFYVGGYKYSSYAANLYVTDNAGNAITQTGASIPVVTGGFGSVVSSSFVIPAGVTSIKVGVMWAQPHAASDMFFINYISLQSELPSTSIGYINFTTDPDNKKVASFIDAEGRTLASALVTSSSPYVYSNWSYTYYNDIGQVVATVAPNGVTGTAANPNYATIYKYDYLGRLIETSSLDEGTSRFVYSTDGKIRFSQNQEQYNASPKRFSYTNYDYLGRAIEAGEFTSRTDVTGTAYVFEPHTTTTPATNSVLSIIDKDLPEGYDIDLNITSAVYPLSRKIDTLRCTDYTFIKYDKQQSDLPSGDSFHATQDNLYGEIAKTENANAKTWYSYDVDGQLIWTKQSVKGLSNYKTVDYTYDYLGNVIDLAYQKNVSGESFYHHYTYDEDQRLTEVRTSTDGINKTLHATYKYYLHGPLKRVEIASLSCQQGIDYVYTIDGALKSINHGDPAKDPGQDGITGSPNASFKKDFFGETLLYNDNDYTGASYNAGVVTLDNNAYKNSYAGMLRGVMYNNATELNVGAVGNAKHVYAYQYDGLNQLLNARYGNIDANSTSPYNPSLVDDQQEKITSYDKNGNIQGLIRNGKSQSPTFNTPPITANYSYIYENNSNKLDKINHNGSQLIDYSYDAIGRMTEQYEDTTKHFKVSYNAYGLVKDVKDDRNRLAMTYVYDDRGDLIKRVTYYRGSIVKNTYYIHDASGNNLAIYEQILPGTLQLTEIPIYGSGRIAVYKRQQQAFFYEVSDHLGNVRAVCGLPEKVTETFFASMESERSEEVPSGAFKNISNTRATYLNADHTHIGNPSLVGNPNEAIRLNNAKPAGPTLSLAVTPGDKIDIDAWGYYEGGSGFSNSIDATTLTGFIASAFGGIPGDPGEAGKIFTNVSTAFPGSYPTSTTADDVPQAYILYVIYDKNYKRITFGSKGISSNANLAKEHLVAPTITIEQPGYVYVCLFSRSNNGNYVYFDDFNVVQTHSAIVSGSDFYPFGLALDGRENNDEAYRYGYQGQNSEKNEKTGWNEFELRMYDARFGRWLSPDPYGQYASPYVGMGNIPNMGSDPNGGVCCNFASDVGLSSEALTASVMGNLAQKTMPVMNEIVTVGTSMGASAGMMNHLLQGSVTWNDVSLAKSGKTRPGYYSANPDEIRKPILSDLLNANYLKNDVSTLTVHNPGLMEQWGSSTGLVGSITYETADAVYLASHFFMPWKQAIHLDGRPVVGWDKSNAFAITASTFIPAGPKGATHSHHIITRQLFVELDLAKYGFKLDHIKNLIDLPTPFHGNHPSYTNYVRKQIANLETVTLENLIDIQTEMTKQIQRIHSSGAYKRLNHYYKNLGL